MQNKHLFQIHFNWQLDLNAEESGLVRAFYTEIPENTTTNECFAEVFKNLAR